MTRPPADPPGLARRVCTVAGCGRGHHGLGLCRAHWTRARRCGSAAAQTVIRAAPAVCGYYALRRRLTAVRGPAAALPCAECARPARVWSYDGTDPDARTDPARGYRYSLDLFRYRPRCRSCHRCATGPGGAGPLDVSRAARLYEAGASSRGIGALLGASPSAVLRALRARGVPIRDRARSSQ